MTSRTESLSLRAERTRNHLSELVDDLQQQITPTELVNQLVGFRASHRGPGIAQTIADQVSKNPLACVLIAVGVGWLMISDQPRKNLRPQRSRVAGKTTARRNQKRRVQQKKAA